MSRKPSAEDFIKLEEMAKDYRLTGNSESAEYIIEWFKPLINMYCRIVTDGPSAINYKHQYTMQFVSIFTKDFTFQKHAYEGKFKAGDRKYNKKTLMEKTVNASDHIRNIYSQFADHKDFYQIACITVLEMTKRYSPYVERITRLNPYIYKNFNYWYKKFLFQYIKPFPAKEFPVLHNLADQIRDPEATNMFIVADRRIDLDIQIKSSDMYFKKEEVSIIKDEFFDINWMFGSTCAEVFKVLTKFERRLLVSLYIDNMNLKEVGEEYGMHRETIMKKRNAAIEKLKEALDKERNM